MNFLINQIFAILSGNVNTPETPADVVRTRALRHTLNFMGFKTYAAIGSYLGTQEHSIVVMLPSENDLQKVMEVARAFNQKQVFFANRGVFTAPFVDQHRENYSVLNEVVTGAQALAQDGYTEFAAVGGAIIFSIPDLYEQERSTAPVSLAHQPQNVYSLL